MFALLGRLTSRFPWWILLAWVALGVGLTCVAPDWDGKAQDDDIRFLPERCDSVRGYRLLQQAFPAEAFASRVILAVERKDAKLTDDDLRLADAFAADMNALRKSEPTLKIRKVVGRHEPFIGGRMLSDDGRCVLVQVSLDTPYLALQTRNATDRIEAAMKERLASHDAPSPEVYVTGPAGIGRDLINAGGNSLDATTVATVGLVIVILLCVYRSPVMALIPLVSIAVAVWVAIEILALMTLIPGFYLVNISKIFAVVMLYGAGTDYCLFLISRYREELAAGHESGDALSRAVAGVGGAIGASAGTVIVGLGMMAFAEFAKVKCGGPAIAVSLAVALVASLTLTPALLRLCGKGAFWPVGTPKPAETAEPASGLWDTLSRFVERRPILVASVSTAALLPLAVLGLHVKPTYRATAELSSSCSSIRGLEAIQRHFVAGEVGPVTVFLAADRDWGTPEGSDLIERLARSFKSDPNVAEVRTLVEPLGKPVEEPAADPKEASRPFLSAIFRGGSKLIADQVAKASKTFYVGTVTDDAGKVTHVTRLDVVLKSDPFDAASTASLERMRVWLTEVLPTMTSATGSVRAETYGVTVNCRDMAIVTESDRQRVNALVMVGIFLILLVLVRDPAMALYLLATVLLSYFATLGATTLMAGWLHGRPLGEIDWRVPFFLFTILVAVGEDYNIFLVTRALEERDAGHGGVGGMRRALAHTGGTITSCGLIMAGTFATLMLAGLNTLVQVGFALAFGVLLDTFVVRPLMVPAVAMLLWREETPEVVKKVSTRRTRLRRAG